MATISTTITNKTVTLSSSGSYGSPLTISSGGYIDNITNGTALDSPGASANYYLDNQGRITAAGALSSAIVFQAGGTIVNSGTISGGNFGIQVFNGFTTVINSGTIMSPRTGYYSYGIRLHSGYISNSSVGYIHGDNRGVDGDNAAPVTLVNAGRITGGSYTPGAAVQMFGGGVLTNSGTISDSSTYGVRLNAATTVTNSGTISGGGGKAAITFLGTGGNLLVLEHGYSLVGGVSVAGTANALELAGATGAVTVNFDKAGAGFTNFGTATFGPTGGNNEILQITNTAALPGTISGFTLLHEIVDLTQFTSPGSAVVNFNSVTNQLTITEGAQSVTLQLGSGSYAGVSWTPGTDSSTGTAITAMCFVRGTRILTPDGEVPVEELAIGGNVATLSGAARRIKWIGRRAYDGRFTAGNLGVLPVRIAAGALADGVPSRDLRVSPEHALHIDGALAPARLLVNGATITQAEDVEQVEYFHIELDTHDVILAEGAPAETYIDCDNRFMFHNAGEFARLYPEEPLPGWQSCALRLEEGAPELVGIRAGIARRAGLPEVTAPAPETGTDHLPNPAMTGALIGIVGQGGALPTGWHVYSAADLNYAVVGHGEEDGIDYVDLRIFGTPSATTNANQIFFTGSSEMRAGIGQRWSAAAYVQLCAGSLENVRGVEIGANLNDADGKYSSWFRSTAFTPLQEALGRRRFARSGTIADRNAAYLQPLLQVGAMAGQAIDLTLRIGHPRAVLLDPGSFGENRRAAA